ncbi:unnamed protein product [Echinostoma caproni]|uniref:Uncharacterized protein n=1 Tax=Echinostoma caproni TaxID=27848 RepID=A0A183B5I8_9TREM|nr:unnamed protein product [Echinostoma caproni]
MRRELYVSLRRDHEIWWSQHASETERAAALGMSETIYEADGSLIYNQQRRLERWMERFKAQFGWPPAPTSHTAIPVHVPWSVSTDPPSEVEIRKEILALGRHKAPALVVFSQLYLKMVE